MAQSAECKDCLQQLQAYADNELDAAHAAQAAAHLRLCSKCRDMLEEAQALSAGLRQNLPRHAPPPGFEEKILAALPKASRNKEFPGAGQLRWILPGFSAAALALSVFLFLSAPSSQDLLADEVVSSHVRALMGQHATDVLSSDQHTVKPWFTGKIDFSPPVRDFAAQGYALVGGRLDYLQHEPAAALVYRHKKHLVNVFVRAAPDGAADTPPREMSRRGYNLILWRQGHLSFAAVSDMNGEDLKELCGLIVQPPAP